MTRVLARLTIAVAVACVLPACGGGSPPGPSPTTPRVTAITPLTGSTLGGTVVTITGANFAAGATVTIGGAAARDVSVSGTTAITATTSAHTAGSADVVVLVGAQSATLPGGFTYVIPPATSNQPPAITALRVKGTRENEPERFADLGEDVEVSAAVTDAETAPDALQYEWASPVGVFSGSGANVTWRAPSASPTPTVVTLTLTVVETYTAPDASGLPVSLTNKTTGSVAVNLHASTKEVEAMAAQFIEDFSEQRPASVTLQNFMACPGRDSEASDIADNLATVVITAYTLGAASAQVQFGSRCAFRSRRADACAQIPVRWVSTVKATGASQVTTGTDHVTAFYERPRWWLCDSDFEGANSLGVPLMR